MVGNQKVDEVMRKLSLFSGIGGIDLAAKWAGMETVAFCEWEKFTQQVLKKNFPGIPVYGDVRDLTKERLKQDGIIGPGRTIDIISAGYPCQPFSYAGQRKGENDDRHLWPEVMRLLQETNADWFVGENVSGHITMGLDTVLADLEYIGYTGQAFHIPAIAVDADHERYRIFVVAYSNEKSGLQENQAISAIGEKWETWKDACRSRGRSQPRKDWGISGPPIYGAPNGLPGRLDVYRKDRCYALGNAVDPYQIYPILAAIKAINDNLQLYQRG